MHLLLLPEEKKKIELDILKKVNIKYLLKVMFFNNRNTTLHGLLVLLTVLTIKKIILIN